MENQIKEWLGSGAINIFGMPYAGKDTLAAQLAELLGAVKLSGGEIIRNSEVPEDIRQIESGGVLIPSEDYVRIVLPYLSKNEFAGKPLILSSVGRWSGEEKGVIQALESSNHPLKAVIHLSIDDNVMRERWRQSKSIGDRGERSDDAAEHLLDVRLAEYRNKTLPVLQTYRDMGLLTEIDANHDVNTVFEKVIEVLSKLHE